MPSAHRRHSGIFVGAVLSLAPTIFIGCSTSGTAQKSASRAPAMSVAAEQSSPSGITWGPAPDVFPPGAQMAVIQGNPGAAEPFVVRLRFPNDYAIKPHTHPTDEHITVMEGTLKVGMGSTFDESAMTSLAPGDSATARALQAHYAKAVGQTMVQVSATGPFALTYVNPADLPKKASR